MSKKNLVTVRFAHPVDDDGGPPAGGDLTKVSRTVAERTVLTATAAMGRTYQLLLLLYSLESLNFCLVASFHQISSRHHHAAGNLHQDVFHRLRTPSQQPFSSSTRLSVFDRMSEECVNAVVSAQSTANKLMLEEVDCASMMIGCVDHPETRALERTFQQHRITYRGLSYSLQQSLASDSAQPQQQSRSWLAGFKAAANNDNDRPFSKALQRAFARAGKLADRMESQKVSSHHVFLSLLGYQYPKGQSNDQEPSVALADTYSEDFSAWQALQLVLPNDGSVTALQLCQSLLQNLADQQETSGPELVTGTGGGNAKTPTLSEVGTDLTALAKDGLLDPVYGREAELKACLRTLLRRRKNNVVLIGEPGVGKTAIAEGVAQLLVSEDCPPKLLSHRLISLELSALVAGTKYRGEFEERLQSVLQEVLDPKAPPTILFIDEIHNLVGAGAAEGGMDAANLLKPALARGEMQLIGATTIAEYRKYIEKDGALERRLQPVMVRESSVDQTVGILEALQSNYERHHGVKYTTEALRAAASLSERYISDRFLPDKAIDLLDEAGAIAQLESTKSESPVIVDEHIVAEVISEMTGIPIGKLESSEMDRLQSLESHMEGRVKGQRRAVRGVARAIRRARSGLRDPRRPIASFLFCGPTGTGKDTVVVLLFRLPSLSMRLIPMLAFYRENGTVQNTGRDLLWFGKRHDSNRYERVHGQTHSLSTGG